MSLICLINLLKRLYDTKSGTGQTRTTFSISENIIALKNIM